MAEALGVAVPWLEVPREGHQPRRRRHDLEVGHQPDGEVSEQLDSADIVLVDYALNDRPGGWWDTKGAFRIGWGEIISSFRELMALLIGLPRKPAVMVLETLVDPGPDPRCGGLTDIRTFPHWEVEQELLIPTISYGLSACPSGDPQWFLQGWGYAHPNDTTHDLVARTVLGSLLIQMNSVSSEGISGLDHPVVRPDPVSSCLAAPLRAYSRYLPDFVPVAKDEAWEYIEDVKGKVGWIVPESAPSSEIAFDVTTRVGWVQVEFLGSWTNIGTADVWMDSSSMATCLLDGLWDQRVSESRFSLMKVGLPPGNHTLHFRSRGGKFKLMGVVSC
eukprot:CAMPEP_0204538504 /NCGR_PEP_ID=MMETSP0661-20131031/16051_1 /ASSEMBLY_ACC=CAM_ASM_000606 /TAXON_ID=109239 /ORGANISM="Alexandrium margalefi, Strain AMGDE01CS-322" /LENGTH=331 /DNA_ID=CAMNT_0051545089 /DNA_START=9 /DNA_END=1004 /DNA_ORIENTATION=-